MKYRGQETAAAGMLMTFLLVFRLSQDIVMRE